MISDELRDGIINEFGVMPLLTGSRFICDSVPDESDWDYVLQVPNLNSEVAGLIGYLAERDFVIESGEHYQVGASTFISMRKDNINFLISKDKEWCKKHRIATRLCKKLKLNGKADRVAVFQALLYGKVSLEGEE